MYIFGHVPPGIYERHYSRQALHWFQDRFNRKYLALVQSYSDVIAGQFFGHAHTDSFRVIYDDNGLYYPLSSHRSALPAAASVYIYKENKRARTHHFPSSCLIQGLFLLSASVSRAPAVTHTNVLISLERRQWAVGRHVAFLIVYTPHIPAGAHKLGLAHMIWILKSRDGDSFPPTSSFAFLSNSWLIKVQNFPCFTIPLAIFIRNLMSDNIHLRCVNTTAGRPISWILLAPAVSPREPGLAEGAGPNNPAIRLVKFNTNNGQVRRKLRLNVSSHVHPSSVNRKDKKKSKLLLLLFLAADDTELVFPVGLLLESKPTFIVSVHHGFVWMLLPKSFPLISDIYDQPLWRLAPCCSFENPEQPQRQ